MDRLITIVGPTAVGKTDLTLSLATYLQTEVISGDAYQVYKDLSIGTAKPTTTELDTVPHHLIDILEPNDEYSVSVFKKSAESIIKNLNGKGKIPILSGGTGLYVQSLLENYGFNDVEPNKELRLELDALYEQDGIEGLRSKANTLANHLGIQLVLTDKHRLYRAIELMESGSYESLLSQTKEGLSYEGPVLGLRRTRDDLYNRINMRVLMMFEAGLVDEVKSILDAGVSPHCQAFKGIGYKEVVQFLDGHISYDECIDLVQKNTRHFAKRQITWYKRMPYIEWIDIDESTSKEDILCAAKCVIHRVFQI